MPCHDADRKALRHLRPLVGATRAGEAPGKVAIDSDTVAGLCVGGPWDGSPRLARSACGRWVRWQALRHDADTDKPQRNPMTTDSLPHLLATALDARKALSPSSLPSVPTLIVFFHGTAEAPLADGRPLWRTAADPDFHQSLDDAAQAAIADFYRSRFPGPDRDLQRP